MILHDGHLEFLQQLLPLLQLHVQFGTLPSPPTTMSTFISWFLLKAQQWSHNTDCLSERRQRRKSGKVVYLARVILSVVDFKIKPSSVGCNKKRSQLVVWYHLEPLGSNENLYGGFNLKPGDRHTHGEDSFFLKRDVFKCKIFITTLTRHRLGVRSISSELETLIKDNLHGSPRGFSTFKVFCKSNKQNRRSTFVLWNLFKVIKHLFWYSWNTQGNYYQIFQTVNKKHQELYFLPLLCQNNTEKHLKDEVKCDACTTENITAAFLQW